MSDEQPKAMTPAPYIEGDTKVGDHLHVVSEPHEDCGHALVLNHRHTEVGEAARMGYGGVLEENGDSGERTIQVGGEVITVDRDDEVKDVIRLRGEGASGPPMVNSRAYRNNYDTIFGKKESN